MPSLLQLMLFIGIALYGTIVRGAPLAVDALFTVDLKSTANGGCLKFGEAKANKFLAEAERMAAMGEQLVDDYGSQGEATRLIHAFVGQLDAADVRYLKSWYTNVRRFLNTGLRPAGNDKPYLFCHHTWLEKKKMTDLAWNSAGEEIPNPNLNGLPAQIRDVQEYDIVAIESTGGVPYWSKIHKSYLFDHPYEKGGYCGPSQNKAVTSELLLPATVTLCERSYNANRDLGAANVRPFASKLIPTEPGKIPSGAQRLDSLLPTSITFFHELFHLVMGTHLVPLDNEGNPFEEYDIIKMGKLGKENALKNAETYSVMAVAYHYTRNTPPVNGHRVEFYAYFPTRA